MKKVFGMKQMMAACLVVPALVWAGSTAASKDPHAQFKQLTIQQVADLNKSHDIRAVDANDAETRAQYGMVPGAIALSGHNYDVKKELPSAKDTKLVFYCGDTKCMAAPGAAKRAVEAGYTDVAVMPEGIRGWIKAGMPVDKAAAPKS